MTPEAFILAFHEAFGANTQLPIAFGFSDETVTLADKFISYGDGMLYMGTGELQERIPNFVSNIELYQQTFNRDKE